MYKSEEAAHLREEFWTAFGRYMNPVPSSEGLKINWINYRTTFKDVNFRMDASGQSASISISLEHSDEGMRALYFQQFEMVKPFLQEALAEEWEWQRNSFATGKEISRIYKELPDCSIFNKDDWPRLISFFKPRITALDRFWEDARYSFESLR